MPHWVEITARLCPSRTSDFTDPKLPGRAVHLLLGVHCSTHCCICILAPPARLEVSSLGVRRSLDLQSEVESSGELGPALKSCVLWLLGGSTPVWT